MTFENSSNVENGNKSFLENRNKRTCNNLFEGNMTKRRKAGAFNFSPSGKNYAMSLISGTIEERSPVSDTWKILGPLDRFCLPVGGLVALDGSLYVADGYAGSMKVCTLATNEHFNTANMIQRRSSFAFCAHKGVIFAVGGWSIGRRIRGAHLRFAEMFIPAANAWKSCSLMVRARSKLAAVSCGEFVYAIGGEGDGGRLSCIERYDPGTDMWQFRGSLREKREWHGAVACGIFIFVMGGRGDADGFRDQGAPLRSAEIYNSETGEVFPMAPMNAARYGFGTTINGNEIHCVGGYGAADEPLQTTEVYDIGTGVWKTGGDTVSVSHRVVCATMSY